MLASHYLKLTCGPWQTSGLNSVNAKGCAKIVSETLSHIDNRTLSCKLMQESELCMMSLTEFMWSAELTSPVTELVHYGVTIGEQNAQNVTRSRKKAMKYARTLLALQNSCPRESRALCTEQQCQHTENYCFAKRSLFFFIIFLIFLSYFYFLWKNCLSYHFLAWLALYHATFPSIMHHATLMLKSAYKDYFRIEIKHYQIFKML